MELLVAGVPAADGEQRAFPGVAVDKLIRRGQRVVAWRWWWWWSCGRGGVAKTRTFCWGRRKALCLPILLHATIIAPLHTAVTALKHFFQYRLGNIAHITLPTPPPS